MNLHEYQAKSLLLSYEIPIPPFVIISSAHEIAGAFERLGVKEAILKIQIYAGGRGKAGGVKKAKSVEEAEQLTRDLLSLRVINNQTGSQGILAKQILVTPVVSIKKEFYIGAIIDRKSSEPVLMVSSEGGVDIEETAAKHPERIVKEKIEAGGYLRNYQLIRLTKFLGWKGDVRKQGIDLLNHFVRAFWENDASLLEINPLVLTKEDQLSAIDVKCSIDDNALFRHPSFSSLYDPSQYTQSEVLAHEADLAYVGLDGDIGCMVNGAGLAMATMDIIAKYHGHPANFLDVGGGASMEKVAKGFSIILADERVKVIFVNIFGGIMDCDVIAQGIIEATHSLKLRIPLIVRLEGTNVEKARQRLSASGLSIQLVRTLAEGASKAVEAARGNSWQS